jgi:hypothetical protein
MISGRFWLMATTVVGTAVAAASGCGGGHTPCTSCPPIDGRYPLEFSAGTLPANCASLSVTLPQGPLDIQHTGNLVTATLDGVEMQGTLYQSFDFTLLGSQPPMDGGSTQFSISGIYTPGSADGGSGKISGSFTGNYTRPSAQGASSCSIFRAYTATQQGQP